jgi:hypothetical protein
VGLIGFLLAIPIQDIVIHTDLVCVERHPSIIRASHCVARLMERFSCVVSNTSLITGTLSTVIRKSWIAKPTGISERPDRYLPAFSAVIIFRLTFSEKRMEIKNHRRICSR